MFGRVAELVDALASGASERNLLGVQVSLRPQINFSTSASSTGLAQSGFDSLDQNKKPGTRPSFLFRVTNNSSPSPARTPTSLYS